MTLAAIIGYFGLTIYLANQEERKRKQDAAEAGEPSGAVKFLLYLGAGLVFYMGITVLLTGLAGDQLAADGEPMPEIGAFTAGISFIITTLVALALFSVVNSVETRRRIQEKIGGWGAYDADSIVHTTAIVMTVLLLTGWWIGELFQDDVPDLSVWEILFQLALEVFFALLGVGWTIRRTFPAVMARLGLHAPTQDDVVQGLLTGIMLIGLLWIYNIIGGFLIDFGLLPETTEQAEAAEKLYRQYATIPGVLLLSIAPAIGEELLFRGALQPIFGLVLTSFAFALMHITTIAPFGLVFIFLVAYMLGRLRDRYSLTAAMIAHFVYNFIQLLFFTLAVSSGAV
jgi:uncharacterized protein